MYMYVLYHRDAAPVQPDAFFLLAMRMRARPTAGGSTHAQRILLRDLLGNTLIESSAYIHTASSQTPTGILLHASRVWGNSHATSLDQSTAPTPPRATPSFFASLPRSTFTWTHGPFSAFFSFALAQSRPGHNSFSPQPCSPGRSTTTPHPHPVATELCRLYPPAMATPSQVVEAFRNLPTNQARVAAINALLDELTPAEWRAAKAKAAQRTFTFDVIGSLPVELAAQVFSHLDIATPFRLQRVCPLGCLPGIEHALNNNNTGVQTMAESPCQPTCAQVRVKDVVSCQRRAVAG